MFACSGGKDAIYSDIDKYNAYTTEACRGGGVDSWLSLDSYAEMGAASLPAVVDTPSVEHQYLSPNPPEAQYENLETVRRGARERKDISNVC